MAETSKVIAKKWDRAGKGAPVPAVATNVILAVI